MEHFTDIRAMVSLKTVPLYFLAVRSHHCPSPLKMQLLT